MAETLQAGCDGIEKWHWYNIMRDLDYQGGLQGVMINPLSVHTNGCSGITQKGTEFWITWVHKKFLLVSTSKEEQELIDAFAKVVEYKPFCRYLNQKGILTFEWDKEDPVARLEKIKTEQVSDLKTI